MKEEGTDEVSCPEKTVCLWLKLLLPLQSALPHKARDKSEGGRPFWKHKQVSDSQRSRVNGRTSSSEHLSLLCISSRIVSYTCTYMSSDLKWTFVNSCLLLRFWSTERRTSLNSFTGGFLLLRCFTFSILTTDELTFQEKIPDKVLERIQLCYIALPDRTIS